MDREDHDSVEQRDIPDRLYYSISVRVFRCRHTRTMGENNMNTRDNRRLLLVGEDIHILNPCFQAVLDRHDDTGLIRLAQKQINNGAMALDLNPGPARDMADLINWAVKNLQKRFSIPLFLAPGPHLEPALQQYPGKITINAATADPAHLTLLMRLAKKYHAELVILLTRPGMQTIDIQNQLQLAMDVIEQADKIGMPRKNIYLDPVFSVRTDPLAWNLSGGMPDLDRVLELISLIGELTNQKAKTILALSNGTMGIAAAKRSALHYRMLPVLASGGLSAVILNCRDHALMRIARNLNNQIHQKAA